MRNIVTRLAVLILLFPVVAIVVANQAAIEAQAQISEPGWYPYTFARGTDRDVIKSTPMHLRPYRPFHFYGNTQRRAYYRGNPLPTIRDIRLTARNLVTPSRLRIR